MDPEERLERFDRALEALGDAAEQMPIIVEGSHDVAALRLLGIPGQIIAYNSRSIVTLADDLLPHKSVVVLFDWDRKGGQLTQLLTRQLAGQVRFDLEIRKAFATCSLVKCVEDLPAARRHLVRRIQDARVTD